MDASEELWLNRAPDAECRGHSQLLRSFEAHVGGNIVSEVLDIVVELECGLDGLARAETVLPAAKRVPSVPDFGWSVAVAGRVAVIGAPYGGPTGQAYVVRATDNWTVTRRLTAADLPEDTEFGHSVSLDDATALVGAPAFRASTDAYLFEL